MGSHFDLGRQIRRSKIQTKRVDIKAAATMKMLQTLMAAGEQMSTTN